jgi:hypothetical protein
VKRSKVSETKRVKQTKVSETKSYQATTIVLSTKQQI